MESLLRSQRCWKALRIISKGFLRKSAISRMNEKEIFYTIALTRMTGFNFQTALQLYQELGGGLAVYEHHNDIRDVLPDCSKRLIAALQDWSLALARAEQELTFIEKHHIRALCYGDDEPGG